MLGIDFSKRTLLIGAIVCALATLPEALRAQGDAEIPPAEASPEKSAVPREYASPRDTLETFLKGFEELGRNPDDPKALERIYGTLQISSQAGALRADVARTLLDVLKGLVYQRGESVSDLPHEYRIPDREQIESAPEAERLTRFELFPADERHPARHEIDTIIHEVGTRPPGTIELVRTESGAWQFSSETIGEVNALYEWMQPRFEIEQIEVGPLSPAMWLRAQMPEALKRRVFTFELWQWSALLGILLICVIVDFVVFLILRPIVRRVVLRCVAEPPLGAVRLAVRPLALVAGALAYLALLRLLGATGNTLTVLVVAGRLVLTIAIVWSAWSGSDLISSAFLDKARATESKFDDMIVPLVRKSSKLFIIAMGLIYIASALEIELAPLLASFGLAGLAVSFAAQDTVRNLFGGLTIFLDRPFKIGERVILGDHDGVIEEIGFRSTKLRTLTGHLVTIPNGGITHEAVENVGRRPTIRRVMNLGITYDTSREKIEDAVTIVRSILDEEGIREAINPIVNGNRLSPQVYFNGFEASSLNIFAIYWFSPPAYWDYLQHGQRVNLRIFEEFEKAGIEFAFPTQTLYMAGDPNRELSVNLSGGPSAVSVEPTGGGGKPNGRPSGQKK